jgi:uncharacterized membrane protein
MNWYRRRWLAGIFRHSLWGTPVACMAAALLAAPSVRWIDDQTQWTLMGFGLDGAKALLAALASSLLTFIVFAFSILLLAGQIAGGQLSPRIIARVFESRLARLALGVFVFSFTFSIASLGRIEGRVQQLPVMIAVLSSLASVVLFIYLIHGVCLGFRPITILTRVAEDTKAVIETLYPRPYSEPGGERAGVDSDPGRAVRTIEHRGRSGVVADFFTAGLVDAATRAGCTIELVPEVGDFLARGEDIFRLYGAGAEAVEERRLRRCVELAPERTLEKDPAFGFRIIVDIASKALSPAINDPTTAVLAVDQLEHLLRLLGQRQLDEGVVRDSSGEVRLVHRTPDWEDFVSLAVTEIRIYGATSPQVPRRLQAMLEHLAQILPPQRGEALRRELGLLERTVERSYADPEDRAMSEVADLQGFGSRTRRRKSARR